MMRRKAILPRAARLLAAFGCLAAAGCASLGGGETLQEPHFEATLGREPAVEYLRAAQGMFVVVDLDTNELRFVEGDRVLWRGPVGTGTGLRLKDEAGDWDFSTPNGVFFVQYKELDPVWELPDWYFVENKLPIPPESSPKRRQPGALGAAAIYLGEEISIHGTDKPELLGQRVSHGCIRISNPNARRLFHNVQVGTPVVVIGGPESPPEDPPPSTSPGKPRPKKPNPLEKVATTELFRRLDLQLAKESGGSWADLASVLISRGIDDDAMALRGLLARAGQAKSEKVDVEYSTFLADAFTRGSLRAVVSLARIKADSRDRAAEAIVEATMRLYPGAMDAPTAPWPTRRVPSWKLGPDGSAGWKALVAAEKAYRDRLNEMATSVAARGGR